jgi:hypothetical protein
MVERISRYIAIVSFFLILIALCLFKVVNPDFGWQLKAGEYIWTTWSIPTHDIFSYIAEGRRWVDSHWLFQVVLYGAHSVGGIPGIIFLRIAMLVSTFALLFSTVYRKEYLPISIVVLVLTLFTCYQRFVIRPELFSFFFLAVFFYFMERFSEHPRLSLVVISFCQAMWANMHGLHALGIVFLGLYILGDVLQVLLARFLPRIDEPTTSTLNLGGKGCLFGLACLASLANANGIDGILYPYTIFSELRREVAGFPNVDELRPLFSIFAENRSVPHPFAVFWVLLPLSILSWIGPLKRIRFAHVLPYAAFLYLSILGVRNIAPFAIVAAPITIRNLNGIVDIILAKRPPAFPNRRHIAVATALSMVLFTAGVWVVTTNNQLYARLNWKRAFGVGESDHYPREAIEHLRAIEGRFFNTPAIGGYLIWKLYPDKQVAVDGRWEVYGDSVPALLKAAEDPAAFSALAAKYDISAAVFVKGVRGLRVMGPWFQDHEEWELTVITKNALIFERVDR